MAVFRQRGAIGLHCLFQPRRPSLTFPEGRKGTAEVHLRHCPVQRRPVLRAFRQRGAIGHHRLFQSRLPGLACSEGRKGNAEVHLGHGPVQRHPVLPAFRQCGAIGLHRLFQPRRPGLACSEGPKAKAEVIQGRTVLVGAVGIRKGGLGQVNGHLSLKIHPAVAAPDVPFIPQVAQVYEMVRRGVETEFFNKGCGCLFWPVLQPALQHRPVQQAQEFGCFAVYPLSRCFTRSCQQLCPVIKTAHIVQRIQPLQQRVDLIAGVCGQCRLGPHPVIFHKRRLDTPVGRHEIACGFRQVSFG